METVGFGIFCLIVVGVIMWSAITDKYDAPESKRPFTPHDDGPNR